MEGAALALGKWGRGGRRARMAVEVFFVFSLFPPFYLAGLFSSQTLMSRGTSRAGLGLGRQE